MLTNAPRATRAIPSAPQPGGAIAAQPSPPRTTEPRKPGDAPTAKHRKATRIAELQRKHLDRLECAGVTTNTDLLDQEPVAKPRRESARPELTLKPRYAEGTPNTEKPCTATLYARGRSRSPAATRTITAPRPADVLAARRTVQALTRAANAADAAGALLPAAVATSRCKDCQAPRHKRYSRCLEHQRVFWRDVKRADAATAEPADRLPPPGPRCTLTLELELLGRLPERTARHHGAPVIALLRALLALVEGAS